MSKRLVAEEGLPGPNKSRVKITSVGHQATDGRSRANTKGGRQATINCPPLVLGQPLSLHRTAVSVGTVIGDTRTRTASRRNRRLRLRRGEVIQLDLGL